MNSTAIDPKEIRSPILASWILLIATCVLAVIPFIGFLSWIVGGVTVTIAIILAIVAISKGGTWSGILVLLAALIVVPLVVFFAPIVSSLITAAILDEKNGSQIEMTAGAAETSDEDAVEVGAAHADTAAEGTVESVHDAAPSAFDSAAEPDAPAVEVNE